MTDSNTILRDFNWNEPVEIQNDALKRSLQVEDISIFIQPHTDEYNKNVWENCAKALAMRSDSELEKHLIPLLEWLQDMNWPGAEIIAERLNSFSDKTELKASYDICVNKAMLSDDADWLYWLSKIICV